MPWHSPTLKFSLLAQVLFLQTSSVDPLNFSQEIPYHTQGGATKVIKITIEYFRLRINTLLLPIVASLKSEKYVTPQSYLSFNYT